MNDDSFSDSQEQTMPTQDGQTEAASVAEPRGPVVSHCESSSPQSPDPDKDQSLPSLAELDDQDLTSLMYGQAGTRVRAALRMVQAAVSQRWNVRPEWCDRLPAVAAKIAASGANTRDQLRALEVLRHMIKDNLQSAMAAHKMQVLQQQADAHLQYVASIRAVMQQIFQDEQAMDMAADLAARMQGFAQLPEPDSI